MIPPDDDDLRTHFDALRKDDQARTPDFRTVLNRVELPWAVPLRRRLPLVWVAAAAVLIASVGIALYERRERAAYRLADSAALSAAGSSASISTWRSPTASLLRVSGGEMLASPRVLSSILDGATNAAVQH
jgi:hypothetical protein